MGDSHTKSSTNWLEEPELPSAEEILSSSSPLLLPIQNESITSKSEYLEKHYRMQRYEAVEPTRLAVSEFRQAPDMPERDLAYVYTDVHVQGIVLTAQGAATRVSFATDRAAATPIDWANPSRLQQGSLVVLSPVADHFKSKCYVATVAYRFLAGGLLPDLDADPPEPENTPSRVDLFFSTWGGELLDPNITFYMLEAKDGYFESVRHTMVALRTAAFEKYVATPSLT
ncbi:DEAD box helicase [Cordyceps fumosorosea ARSEF 2679]|uniref:DEAD box helicase n=1 Tax=Cordyceps fumosorosea (strain ARSEF 2679) TaxID=1081104 RepID=A0A167N438_CORFA|nr:DEAD box helicase [Cordyceps fumosorosea ARSEF 2679]OAA55108.1 DEAD box helicase [Cordyceps fumosorosea ARSEF 2679]